MRDSTSAEWADLTRLERELLGLHKHGFNCLRQGLLSADGRIAVRAGYLLGEFPFNVEAALATDRPLLTRFLVHRWWGLLLYRVPLVHYQDKFLQQYQRKIVALDKEAVPFLLRALEENDEGCSVFKSGASPEMHICTAVIQMLAEIGDARAVAPLQRIAAGRPNWHRYLIEDAERALERIQAAQRKAAADADKPLP